MIITSEAIVISSLKYGDSHLIVHLYTEASGLRSYLIRGVLKSKKGRMRASLFQPLTILDIVASHKDKGNLERLREAKIGMPYKTIHTDFIKNSIVFFIAEIIKNSVKEEESNPSLFNYIKTSLTWLDVHHEVANFHVTFTVKLTQYLGFYPDTSTKKTEYFNLMTGNFQDTYESGHTRRGEAIEAFKLFLGTNFDDCNRIKLTRAMRNEILEVMLLYFELHLHGFKKPKSLQVLNEIFK
ncbi:DNA repair protein RecO [Aquimarina sp. ERC-38]|uniref:DNA repair protein RecO n=1 Tax=Aquimarina sp. ERC-38 TaxID=2949996 RepID=UPI0022454126|nr:DNA repair protein RecO [Aquimarina sp. ERC-38]UZO82049.1 DNA repair protein RecO [Aquimarina sp. ERC-38]